MKEESSKTIADITEKSNMEQQEKYQEGYEAGKICGNMESDVKILQILEKHQREIDAKDAKIDHLNNERSLGVVNLEFLREQHRKQCEIQLKCFKADMLVEKQHFEAALTAKQHDHELELKSTYSKALKEARAQEFQRGFEQATFAKDIEIQTLLDQHLKQNNEREVLMAEELDQQHEKQQALKATVRELKETLKHTQMKMERMENDFRQTKSLSQNEVYELQEQLETSVSTKERLQAELKHAQGQYQVGYDRGVEVTQVSMAQMKAECLAQANDKVKTEMEDLKDQISRLTIKNGNLENHKSSMAAMEKILNRDIKRLQKRVDELKENCDGEFKKGFAEGSGENKTPDEEEFEEIRLQNAQLKHENETLRQQKCKQCAELKPQVVQLQIDLRALKKEAQESFERGKKENQIKLTMLEHEFQALQTQSKNRELTHADLIRQYMKLTQEKEDRQMQMYDRGYQEGLRRSHPSCTGDEEDDQTVELKIPVSLNASSPEYVPTKMDPETPEFVPKCSSAIPPTMNPESKPFVPKSDVLKRTMQCTDYEVRSTYRTRDNNAEEIKVVHSSYTVRQNNDNQIKSPGFIIPPRSKAIRFALGSDGPVPHLS